MNLKSNSFKAPSFSPSVPLRNKRRELFCQLYAGKFWGFPEQAFSAAKYKSEEPARSKNAKRLLKSRDISARVKFLRKQISENSIADDAWIKEHFIEIAESAEKDSDRIRALANLYRAVMGAAPLKKNTATENDDADAIEDVPLFEGGDDE